jgi:hypothetical protein
LGGSGKDVDEDAIGKDEGGLGGSVGLLALTAAVAAVRVARRAVAAGVAAEAEGGLAGVVAVGGRDVEREQVDVARLELAEQVVARDASFQERLAADG